MTSTTIVAPSFSVYTSAANSKSYYQLTIAADKFAATATWLRNLGSKFKTWVKDGIAQFTFFSISKALVAKLQAHTAKRAAEIEAADEAKANGFDTTVPVNAAKVAEAIATSERLQATAVGNGNGFSAASGGDAPYQSYAPAAVEVSAPEFVAATAEQLDRCFTLKALKDICRANGLKVSGTKAQVVARLVGQISVEYCWMAGDKSAK